MVRLGNVNVNAEKLGSRRSEAYHPAQKIMADMILAPYHHNVVFRRTLGWNCGFLFL